MLLTMDPILRVIEWVYWKVFISPNEVFGLIIVWSQPEGRGQTTRVTSHQQLGRTAKYSYMAFIMPSKWLSLYILCKNVFWNIWIALFLFISRKQIKNYIDVCVLICPCVELYIEIDNLSFKYYKSNSWICSNILVIISGPSFFIAWKCYSICSSVTKKSVGICSLTVNFYE